MKKVLIAAPTFILLATIMVAMLATEFSANLKANLLGFGAMGLVGYSFFAIFGYGLFYAFHHTHQKLSEMPRGSRYLLQYLTVVLILTIIIVAYLMAHN